jgi:hypothetical protein
MKNTRTVCTREPVRVAGGKEGVMTVNRYAAEELACKIGAHPGRASVIEPFITTAERRGYRLGLEAAWGIVNARIQLLNESATTNTGHLVIVRDEILRAFEAKWKEGQ